MLVVSVLTAFLKFAGKAACGVWISFDTPQALSASVSTKRYLLMFFIVVSLKLSQFGFMRFYCYAIFEVMITVIFFIQRKGHTGNFLL